MFSPKSTDPREVRSLMHSAWNGYKAGEDLLPRYRFTGTPQDYPRKTQSIARTLFDAWRVIDADERFFLETFGAAANSGLSATVIAKVGGNAVYLGCVEGNGGLHAGRFFVGDFVSAFDGVELPLNDGRTINVLDPASGQHPADLLVVRGSGVATTMFHGID